MPASILQLDEYTPSAIEPHWQKQWDEHQLYQTDTADTSRPKYYALSMFPYPSGKLHMGHVRNYTITDVIARIKRMQGFNVLHPMGWDSFGLPAENAAIQHNIAPQEWTVSNIDTMRAQLQRLGFAYDWNRELLTCRDDYYRWTQWLFLHLYERGLAYKKEAPVNWCDSCNTVLANEQVIEGRCWRDDSAVVRKNLSQWFFKITDYADVLLKDLDLLTGWPERVVTMQRNWIGQSTGALLTFAVDKTPETITVYTTRPDTLFGVSYLVLAPEHPLVERLTNPEQAQAVADYQAQAAGKNEIERTSTATEKVKTGVPLGSFCVHPITQALIPIWIADYALMDYGTGAVMGVPAHDTRDLAFAQTFQLPIIPVIDDSDSSNGCLINSGEFTGLSSQAAKTAIIQHAEKHGWGKAKTQYRLRDWLVSRQRYWGAPIPIVYCDTCGTVPLPESQLPVVLPTDVDFSVQGTSPVATSASFAHTPCPTCQKPARRETDTMDTFVCSSWYYLRFLDAHNSSEPFVAAQAAQWLPVDQYVGGIEHAILHLLYSRFIMHVLRDSSAETCAAISLTPEPFKRLLTQGMVLKDGAKMSKSKGNVVDPDAIIATYGADTARFFILSDSPPEANFDWKDTAVEGCYRFLQKTWRLVAENAWLYGNVSHGKLSQDIAYETLMGPSRALYQRIHKTIAGVTQDVEQAYQFNTVVSKLRELVNAMSKIEAQQLADDATLQQVFAMGLHQLILLLAPLVPHLAEALWHKLGQTGSVHLASWPQVDTQALQADLLIIVVQVNGKRRDQFEVEPGTSNATLEAMALSLEKVVAEQAGRTPKKIIVVPGKLVNIVF